MRLGLVQYIINIILLNFPFPGLLASCLLLASLLVLLFSFLHIFINSIELMGLYFILSF